MRGSEILLEKVAVYGGEWVAIREQMIEALAQEALTHSCMDAISFLTVIR